MSVLDILTKARDLISDPNKWIKGSLARNAEGSSCDANAPHACQFCMIGAIRASSPPTSFVGAGAELVLEAAIMKTKPRFSRVLIFNDHALTTHQDVLDIFSVAIAAELNRENNT